MCTPIYRVTERLVYEAFYDVEAACAQDARTLVERGEAGDACCDHDTCISDGVIMVEDLEQEQIVWTRHDF